MVTFVFFFFLVVDIYLLGGARLGALVLYHIAMSLYVFNSGLRSLNRSVTMNAVAAKAPIQNVVYTVGAVVCLRE